MDLINFYDLVPKSSKKNYKNYDKLQMEVPFRSLFVGTTGSGKTSILMNIIKNIVIWKRIYIVARQPEEELYELLAKILEPVERKTKKQILYITKNISDLPPIDNDHFSEENPTLMVFDDLINGTPKEFTIINEVYLRGRKLGITSIFLSQSYYKTPLFIRQNISYVIFKKIQGKKDFKRIISEYSLDVPEEELIRVYNEIMKGNFLNFLMIDLDHADKRYRFNFTPIGI